MPAARRPTAAAAAAALAVTAALLLARPAAGARSQMLGAEATDEGAISWPRVVQPQPLYVESRANAALRRKKPDDTSLPLPLMVATDVLLTGGCLKVLTFNPAAAVPRVDHVFALVNGSSLVDHLTLAIPSLDVPPSRLTRVAVGGGKQVPVLGLWCHPALEDVVTDVEVLFNWTGGANATDPRKGVVLEGRVTVYRIVPDVDPTEELPESSSGSAPGTPLAPGGAAPGSVRPPVVGVCALFNLDPAASTGWLSYWGGLGVDRFILYFNGRFDALEEGETAHVRSIMGAHPNITLVEWPFPYALPTNLSATNASLNAGQPDLSEGSPYVTIAGPLAATHCWHAYGAGVDVLMFADMKDFPVLPAPASTGITGGAVSFPPRNASFAPHAPSVTSLQTFFSGVTGRRYAGAAGGGDVHVVSLPTFWAATSPGAQVAAVAEMRLEGEPDMVDRVRGDLLTVHFLRSAQVLRGDAPADGVGKYAVARATTAVPGVGTLLLCAAGPCTNVTISAPPAAPAGAADGATAAHLTSVSVSAAEGYVLRLANVGVPLSFADNRTGLDAVLAGATVLDAGFREHVHVAALNTGLVALPRPPSAAAAAPAAACPAPSASASASAPPSPVARLHAELAKSQHHPDCDHEHRRFLVFTYAEEQGINGFAAMFQYYAAALALAHATGRTLVELLPPPVVNATGGSPYSSRQSLYESAATHDPWRRAPAHACRGAKMGCYFTLHASCAVSGVTAEALPRFDFGAELKRLGRSHAAPHRRTAVSDAALAAATGGIGLSKAAKKKWAAANARVVRLDSIGAHRTALLAATRGDFAPAWFRSAAVEWACGACGASALEAAGNASCPAAVDAALAAEDHCATYCSGGPDAAWRRLWFPAFESWLFKPSTAIADATAASLARVTAPADDLYIAAPAAPAIDLPAAPRAAAVRRAGAAEAVVVPVPVTAGSASISATGGVSTSAQAAAAPAPRRPHAAIGVHYRAGDASALVWRSHAPLTSYVQAAKALARGLAARYRLAAGDVDATANFTLAANVNASVHLSLVVATDSAAARASLRDAVYDRLAGSRGLLYDTAANRTANVTASSVDAEPLLALLDERAHRLMEGEERARGATGVLRGLLRDKLAHPSGGTHFDRLALQPGVRLVTKSADELAEEAAAKDKADKAKKDKAAAATATNATAASNATAANATASSSASESATPSPSPSPTGPVDKPVHLETHIRSLLDGARPKIISDDADDSSESDGDDDVFPSRDLDELRMVRVTAGSYAAFPRQLTPPGGAGNGTGRPVGFAEEALAAAAGDVAALTAGVVGDVWLLSHANYLIGTCLSQVSRLAYELAYAAGRARAPPVGLDARLCRSFPMPAPYTVTADWRDGFDVAWVGDE